MTPAPNRRWFRFSPVAVVIAVLLALPGIALAMIAKLLVFGDGFLLLGLLIALGLPIWWLASRAPHI
jgi:hypothetical protein